MTSETHPTAVQTRLRELLLEFARDYQDCRDRLGKPEIALDSFETFLTSNPESPFAQAIRERDEAIELLRERVEAEDRQCWFDHNQNCQEHMSWRYDGTCVVAEARAFLSNFSEEDAE